MVMGHPLHNLLVTQMPVRALASAPGKPKEVTIAGGDLYEQVVGGQLTSVVMW